MTNGTKGGSEGRGDKGETIRSPSTKMWRGEGLLTIRERESVCGSVRGEYKGERE